MIIKVFNEERKYDNPIKLSDLLDRNNITYLAAKVNNRLRELDYIISSDANVEFLDLCNTETMTIYQSTLRYVMVKAIKRVTQSAKVIFNYSISRSIFTSVSGIGGPLNQDFLDRIELEFNKIVTQDLPIKRRSVTKQEAIDYYHDAGFLDKTKILKYRTEDTVHMYECDGYMNYMFGYMLPSTRYLTKYKLKLYTPGFIIQYPRAELNGEIPKFEDAPSFGKALKEANIWGNIIDGSYIAKMNKIIEDGRAIEFINLCETRHNNSLADLGLAIKENIENIRLIAIAGPSSSGKTTFTNRLRIQLMSRNITPLMISIDNYYKSKAEAPKDEFGAPDLEHIEALDIKLFNEQMYKLINGEEVTLPVFDFDSGKSIPGKKVKLGKNQPIMIEGIHALNDTLTPSIPAHQKYKIYISPQAQLHIDDNNPISLTDIRLIRRIVRDNQFRNSSAIETLKMWSSVRRGEFKWIYPYQEKADYVYNSELTYELCVMKKYIIPLLQNIDENNEFFIEANRLIKFMKYFKEIEDKWVPCNSILREFIGGSMFYQ